MYIGRNQTFIVDYKSHLGGDRMEQNHGVNLEVTISFGPKSSLTPCATASEA